MFTDIIKEILYMKKENFIGFFRHTLGPLKKALEKFIK